MSEELVPMIHPSEIIIRNVSTKFRPQNWPYVNFTFSKYDVLVPILLKGVKLTK